MNEKLDQLLEREVTYHGPKLEELINQDLLESMGKATPLTDEYLEQIMKDMK